MKHHVFKHPFGEQHSLPIHIKDDATFANYKLVDNDQSANNHRLIAQALQQQLSTGEPYIYLYGKSGCGRSHLLQAACHHATDQAKACVYLPLAELHTYPPAELLTGLDQLALVCLDDIDTIAGQPQWEEALFSLFNRLAEKNVALLIAANQSVRTLPLDLNDLRSRLSSGVIYRLTLADEVQQQAILRFRAQRRGLTLSDSVIHFIATHCQRHMGHWMTLLDKLDSASLQSQRRLTIPFVKTVLEHMADNKAQ